jgi:hypothetical protein
MKTRLVLESSGEYGGQVILELDGLLAITWHQSYHFVEGFLLSLVFDWHLLTAINFAWLTFAVWQLCCQGHLYMFYLFMKKQLPNVFQSKILLFESHVSCDLSYWSFNFYHAHWHDMPEGLGPPFLLKSGFVTWWPKYVLNCCLLSIVASSVELEEESLVGLCH